MRLGNQKLKLLGVGASCLALGAGASAIATAGAATPASHAQRQMSLASHSHARRRRLLVRAVEGHGVVWTRSGWKTVSFERGSVDSVSGRQLTLTEGTPKHSYQQVTVTVPDSARVRNDRKPAALSSLQRGERVIVVKAPKRMFVIAHAS